MFAVLRAFHLNLAYRRVVQRRADYHRLLGEDAKADKELHDLSMRLQERGANSGVVDRYRSMSGLPDSAPVKKARAP